MNLNGTDKFNLYLKDETIQLGESIDPERVVEFETDWLGTEEDIQFVFGGCHCTDAWYSNTDKKIRGNITVSRAGYDRNTGVLSQHVFVYMNDGKEYFSVDDKKRRITNPDKEFIRINLAGKINI